MYVLRNRVRTRAKGLWIGRRLRGRAAIGPVAGQPVAWLL